MLRFVWMLTVFCAVFLFILGCSGSGTPLVPPSNTPNDLKTAEGGQTLCLGLWQVTVDLKSATIDAVPIRQGDFILNVLGFMEPPPLVNLNIDWTSLHIGDGVADKTITVDVIFTHPIAGDPVFTGFDVRGVVFGPNLANADGLTIIPSPELFSDVPFGYQNGLLGTPEETAHYKGLAGYKYFCDDLGKDDDLVTFFSNPANLANRGKYSSGAVHTRHYALDWDGASQAFFIFNYAVYANYNWPSGEAPIDLEDFDITTANSSEAFCAKVTETANTLYYATGGGGGALSLEVTVWDWQNNVSKVSLESLEAGVIDPVDAGFFGPGSDPFEGVWVFDNIPGHPTVAGDLDLLLTVTDPMTFGGAWFMGLLPTGNSMYGKNVYNCWKYTTTVIPCPPPTITSITPSAFKQTWYADDVQIDGSNFIDGASLAVKLVQTGQPDIIGTDVKFVSGTQITCDLAIPGAAATGAYDVVVTNGCGTDGTGVGLVTIDVPGPWEKVGVGRIILDPQPNHGADPGSDNPDITFITPDLYVSNRSDGTKIGIVHAGNPVKYPGSPNGYYKGYFSADYTSYADKVAECNIYYGNPGQPYGRIDGTGSGGFLLVLLSYFQGWPNQYTNSFFQNCEGMCDIDILPGADAADGYPDGFIVSISTFLNPWGTTTYPVMTAVDVTAGSGDQAPIFFLGIRYQDSWFPSDPQTQTSTPTYECYWMVREWRYIYSLAAGTGRRVADTTGAFTGSGPGKVDISGNWDTPRIGVDYAPYETDIPGGVTTNTRLLFILDCAGDVEIFKGEFAANTAYPYNVPVLYGTIESTQFAGIPIDVEEVPSHDIAGMGTATNYIAVLEKNSAETQWWVSIWEIHSGVDTSVKLYTSFTGTGKGYSMDVDNLTGSLHVFHDYGGSIAATRIDY